MKVLAGDIGGTHARLAVVEFDDRHWRIEHERAFESARYDGLAAIVQAFLGELDRAPERAAFGVACPVVDGVCRLTNLDWTIERARLAGEIGIPEVELLNDFDCVGHALPLLGAGDLVELQPGNPREHGTIALIGAGTGLGEGFLVWAGGRYRVHASEGGHADFAPRSALECRLFEGLHAKYGRVSYERVLSGAGLVEVYRFLAQAGSARERPETRRAMERGDPAAVISALALRGEDEFCVAALDVFVSVYGAQAGNLALTVQAVGGVYVAGGIAPKILDKLREGRFVAAFRDKGRLSDLMATIPVRVIVSPKVGILGAAAAARQD